MRMLVLAAHPDDEVLGCGGFIARARMHGHHVDIAFAGSGVGSRSRKEKAAGRMKMAMSAAKIMGSPNLHFNFFGKSEDNALDGVQRLEVIVALERILDSLQSGGKNGKSKPFDILLTHHPGDLNIDHRRLAEAAVVATRPGGKFPVPNLMFFEVNSSTEWNFGVGDPFLPNYFVDISETLEAKCVALEAYESEVRRFPHPRSKEAVAALARWRGAQCGKKAAEAFMIGRSIL